MFKIKKILKTNPHLRRCYNYARQSRSRVTSVYDVSTSCNLRCDGCLFFNKDGNHSGSDSLPSINNFEEFFVEEKKRGVNYPIFGGAEAGLNQDILLLASKIWSEGMVHSNGTIRFNPDIPFRLYISSWGHRSATNKWRGANCYDKVLNNITGDPRAMVNYTINRANINDILPVVADCKDRNIQITFQVYSPTSDYLNVLNNNANKRYTFVHDSTVDNNLIMRPEDDFFACNIVKNALEKYPNTILFTTDLANWVFSRPGIHYEEVEQGTVTPNCHVAKDPKHQHYLADGSIETRKTCGHPDIECKTCRIYTTIYTSYFQHKSKYLQSTEEITEYFSAHEVFHDIFYIN